MFVVTNAFRDFHTYLYMKYDSSSKMQHGLKITIIT